jgi:hypothetical protein
MRMLVNYEPRARDHDRVESRSSPFVVADGTRACYSGSPNIPGLEDFFEHRKFIAEVRSRMLRRHYAAKAS